MFEFIGIVVVCWLIYLFIKAFFGAKSTVRSKEFGIEAKRICTVDLKVPVEYHNMMTQTNMDAIKRTAMDLKEQDDFKKTSWPRLIALTIYGEYAQTCRQWQMGNPQSEAILKNIHIHDHVIADELKRDPEQVIFSNT